MNRRFFERNVRFFNEHTAARYVLHFVYKVLPMAMFVSYPLLLLYLLLYRQEQFLRAVLVPLGVFAGVTLLRVLVNETRPYERYGQPSVFHKTTKGKSFPSRHTACAFIIGMTFLFIHVPSGIAALATALLIAASRLLAGAHYVHDVAAGMAISVLSGVLFLFIL